MKTKYFTRKNVVIASTGAILGVLLLALAVIFALAPSQKNAQAMLGSVPGNSSAGFHQLTGDCFADGAIGDFYPSQSCQSPTGISDGWLENFWSWVTSTPSPKPTYWATATKPHQNFPTTTSTPIPGLTEPPIFVTATGTPNPTETFQPTATDIPGTEVSTETPTPEPTENPTEEPSKECKNKNDGKDGVIGDCNAGKGDNK